MQSSTLSLTGVSQISLECGYAWHDKDTFLTVHQLAAITRGGGGSKRKACHMTAPFADPSPIHPELIFHCLPAASHFTEEGKQTRPLPSAFLAPSPSGSIRDHLFHRIRSLPLSYPAFSPLVDDGPLMQAEREGAKKAIQGPHVTTFLLLCDAFAI